MPKAASFAHVHAHVVLSLLRPVLSPPPPPPPPEQAAWACVPREARELVRGLLSKDPWRRPSAEQVRGPGWVEHKQVGLAWDCSHTACVGISTASPLAHATRYLVSGYLGCDPKRLES